MFVKTPINDITAALTKVEKVVLATNNAADEEYFLYHKKRFRRMAESLLKAVPIGAKILDIGSHFLHSSMLLTELGYKVFAVDVDAFWKVDFVMSRMSEFKIEGILENNLESFECVATTENEYDVVLFTEIFEHITFNPISFWKKSYKALKPNGLIYLTTPNSLALPSLIRAFRNLILLKGIGITVPEIFTAVTYGHHWKEYSRSEIRQYFKLLSNDFEVNSSFFAYHKETGNSIRTKAWNGITMIGHWTYFFSPSIESIIRVRKKDGFKVESPEYH